MNRIATHASTAARLLSALTVAMLAAISPAVATTFVVTRGDDPSTGSCLPGDCSLRQAIVAANADTASPHSIQFAIAGSGPHRISLASQLPGFTRSTTVDGFSQPGSVMNTLAPDQGGLDASLQIEITGTGSSGFLVAAANGIMVTIEGVAMHGFGAAIACPGGNVGTSQLNVYGTYLGTTIEGAAVGNGPGNHVDISCGHSPIQIGGMQAWQRNLISGAGGPGISVGGPAVIEGNLIGTDASGTQAIPNGATDNNAAITIWTYFDAIRIGGAAVASRNLISGNHTWGIIVGPPYGITSHAGLEIQGNYIGTDWTGSKGLGNGYPDPAAARYGGGIQLANFNDNDANATVLGGFGDGEGNLIAFNRGAGIGVNYNTVGENFDSRGNRIHHNRGVGGANIDIGAFGRTANDPDDADEGANNVQNWPEVIAASQNGNMLTLTYRVDSAPAHASYPLRIDLYADAAGGGNTLLAEDIYPLAAAQQTRTVQLMLPPGMTAIPFVATATDAAGLTSEFSPAFDVVFESDFE